MQLTSPKNAALQAIRRAAAHGSPTPDGLIVAEGPHLVEEALRGAWQLEQILLTPAARDRQAHLLQACDCQVVELSARAFAAIASTETTQEIIALLRPRSWMWQDLTRGKALIAVLDRIQDPGNAGTIVRSAEAFGATGVVFLSGCVRVSNGKLLRATAGSMFRMPFLEGVTSRECIASLESGKLRLYALTAQGSAPLAKADLGAPCALLIGSEGAGLSNEFATVAQSLQIPVSNVESLNAAIAGSIALFCAAEQRRTHEPL